MEEENLKIKEEEDEAASQEIKSRKRLPRVDRSKREGGKGEREGSPSRLNMWIIYSSAHEGFLAILDN